MRAGIAAGLLLSWALAGTLGVAHAQTEPAAGAAGTGDVVQPPAETPAAATETPAPAGLPEATPPPPAPAPPPPEPPKMYGDRGTTRFGLAFGLGNGSGGWRYAAGIDFGYFVLPRIAPGAEVLVTGGTGLLTTTQLLGNLHVIPVRTSQFALTLAGRAGRLFISDHPNLWAVGGGGGVIFFTGHNVGFELAYQVLKLSPASACADLKPSQCTLQGLTIGFVAGF